MACHSADLARKVVHVLLAPDVPLALAQELAQTLLRRRPGRVSVPALALTPSATAKVVLLCPALSPSWPADRRPRPGPTAHDPLGTADPAPSAADTTGAKGPALDRCSRYARRCVLACIDRMPAQLIHLQCDGCSGAYARPTPPQRLQRSMPYVTGSRRHARSGARLRQRTRPAGRRRPCLVRMCARPCRRLRRHRRHQRHHRPHSCWHRREA